MKSIALVIGLVCAAAASCSCSTMPNVTAQVTCGPTSVEYAYTVTNTLGPSEAPLRNFWLYMPEAGARSVLSFTSSRGWYSGHGFRGDKGSLWSLSALIGDELQSGQTMTMTLVTGPGVPTVNDFVADWPGNWGGSSSTTLYQSDTSLPVPAPEPSGLLVLAGGTVGLTGLALRRRRV